MADFASGFTQGFNIVGQAQQMQLRDQEMKLKDLSTFSDIAKTYEVDPKLGDIKFGQYAKMHNLGDEETKTLMSNFRGISDDTRRGIASAALRYGVQNINDFDMTNLLKMAANNPLQLSEYFNKMAGQQAEQVETTMLGNLGAGRGAMAAPPAIGGAPATGTAGALAPTTAGMPAAPATGDLPAVPTGAPAPQTPPGVPQHTVGGSFNISGPGGKQIAVQAQQADSPAFAAAKQANVYNEAAKRMEEMGAQTGNAAFGERAAKLRERAEALTKNSYITLSPPQAGAMGFKPGSVVRYNLINNDMTVLQQGEDQKKVIDFNDPIYKQFRPGAVLVRNLNTGDIEVKQQGEDKWTPLTPDQMKEAGADPGQYGQRSTSGQTTFTKVAEDKFVPLTDVGRAMMKAQGVELDDNRDYQFNKTTNKLETIGERGKKYIDLTPDQMQQLGIPKGAPVVGQREVGTQEVHLKTTGQTTEQKASQLAAERDDATIKELRKQSSDASEALRTSRVTHQLLDQAGTGPLARPELVARQIADAVGFQVDPDKLRKGEALESQLAKGVLQKGRMLPGNLSDRDAQRIVAAGPTMFRTTEGNKLIQDIADWSNQETVRQQGLAEDWLQKHGSLEKVDPDTKKNFYQTRESLDLPPELQQRLSRVEADTPDPKKIKGWQQPISQANRAQLNLLYRSRDKLTPLQAQRAKEREEELDRQGQ